MSENCKRAFSVGLFVVVLGCMVPFAQAQEEERGRERVSPDVDRHARHLYDRALELLSFRQYDRGLEMLNSLVRDYQGTVLAYQAQMAMGKHHLEQNEIPDALRYFMLLIRVLAPEPGEPQAEDALSLYHEALFQAGLSQYQSGQYAAAFPLFRRLTEVASRSEWSNKAYFYIGMSHYHLQNWNQAIEALSLVGTEIEEPGEAMGRIEIGHRFYAKVTDADIPVMRQLGRPIRAEVRVSSGDVEVLDGVPIAGRSDEMLVSAPTEIGRAKPNDGVIQMVGGDTLTVKYIDESTFDGSRNVPREASVRAVSTGVVGFYLGDYTTPAYIAYPGQPLHVMLRDADLDTSPAAESVRVTVRSFQKVEATDAAAETGDMLDIFAARDDEEDAWQERDSVTITLTEQGEGPIIRSGVFVGRVVLAPSEDQGDGARPDGVLYGDELDEIRVSYTDEIHIYGDEPRENVAKILVSGSVSAGVSADQFVVFDDLLRARKESVEAEALIALGQIYKDMGLVDRAAQRANEALKRVNPIIMDRDALPSDLVEKAFQFKWESELLLDQFEAATATCLAFNRLYPESVLADRALMTLGRSLTERDDFEQAVKIYQQVLQLENPISAAEAQFRIGETRQKQAEVAFEESGETHSRWAAGGLAGGSALHARMGPAIAAYRATFQRYPESSYAAEALGRVIRHYVDTNEAAQAVVLLETVFKDYPDATFLDEMLMHWARLAHQMGDHEMAKARLRQLIFDYPSSSYVSDAQNRLAALEAL